jgi:hypothetical protein
VNTTICVASEIGKHACFTDAIVSENTPHLITLSCFQMLENQQQRRTGPKWESFSYLKKTQGVCQTVALPFTLKKYLKAKEEEELWKSKYFTVAKYNLPKKLLF